MNHKLTNFLSALSLASLYDKGTNGYHKPHNSTCPEIDAKIAEAKLRNDKERMRKAEEKRARKSLVKQELNRNNKSI